jgi:transketolase
MPGVRVREGRKAVFRPSSARRLGVSGLHELAQQLRVDSIRCSTSAGSGHPTSCMSADDLLAVLVARHLRYDWDKPSEPASDHLIFSKGHASRCFIPSSRRSG